jgi:hypothetical protein
MQTGAKLIGLLSRSKDKKGKIESTFSGKKAVFYHQDHKVPLQNKKMCLKIVPRKNFDLHMKKADRKQTS